MPAIMSLLDVLNLSEDEKAYLFTKIQTGDYSFNKEDRQEGMRKGFNFTEIEDSNYHDMKSVVHNYSFPTTPEDAILKLTSKALVVGISATAKISTCIGNYDLSYLRKNLKDSFIEITEEDSKRISSSFEEMIKTTQGKYKIHTKVVDDYDVFSNQELCEKLIEELFEGETKEKYKRLISDSNISLYYFAIELKLCLFYKEIGDKKIKSSIAFVNRFPKPREAFDLDRLKEMFEAIDFRFSREKINFKVVSSQTFDDDFADTKDLLSKGKQVLILTTYQTVGSGKNIQYPIPVGQEESMIYDPNDTRKLKDFEAVYVCMPTFLIQNLSYNGEDKYNDLAKYLFQQEYLYQNNYLSYAQMKVNIENGFRQVFFGEKRGAKYTCNGDLYFHALKITIQAIGRICRCRSKNKNIYIYTDRELIENIQSACEQKCPNLLNEEFKALLSIKLNKSATIPQIHQFSIKSKAACKKITSLAYNVRRDVKNVIEWQDMREYVLKNPTAPFVLPQYHDYYFEMPEKISEYSYKQNNRYDIVDMRLDSRYGMPQVGEQACDLPIVLSVPCVEKLFDDNKYAKRFLKNNFVMSPSLFKQVYLGALGEVVGRCILEYGLGLEIEELNDPSFYELFDYKIGNVYFDFKHWNEFRIDNDTYVKKVERKLAKIKGAKCFVINLIKRTDADVKQNISETVIQIPYLIDGETGTINFDAIEEIATLI